MAQVLGQLPLPQDPDLLVGTNTADDAAVYRLNDDLAVVQTVDYFTPVVDDPYTFGLISAANALSDVYAMGARPVLALNLVGFPSKTLPLAVLTDILRGGADKAREAGVVIGGGHTIDDREPKYGMAVMGVVHPRQIITNSGAQPGDALILTKPLGLGIITTGIKGEMADVSVAREAVEVMATLNRAAAEVMIAVGAHACTDVTGFGLIGHLLEMVRGSQTGARIWARKIPVLAGARELAASGIIPGGTYRNLEYISDAVDWGVTDELTRIILADVQTSGGLLIATPPDKVNLMLERLLASGVKAAKIGEITNNVNRIEVV